MALIGADVGVGVGGGSIEAMKEEVLLNDDVVDVLLLLLLLLLLFRNTVPLVSRMSG